MWCWGLLRNSKGSMMQGHCEDPLQAPVCVTVCIDVYCFFVCACVSAPCVYVSAVCVQTCV